MSAPAGVTHTHSPAATAGITDGWLLLALDGLRLALPHREAVLIGLTGDLTAPDHDDTFEIGSLLRQPGPSWPVFSLNGALALERRHSVKRRNCVFFATGGVVRGLACDRLWSLATDAELAVAPVPGCLRAEQSPITGFARYRDDLLAVTRAAELAAYLDFLLEHRHVQHQ